MTDTAPSRTPRPFVLVHGAWAGAWIWRRVLGPLRAAGHEVHAVTLTGVGERAHLRTPAIDLGTHVDDVLGLVGAEELSDVVLVGHSYAGMVVTGAADRLPDGGVGSLVWIDAVVPLPGESWSSLNDDATRAQRQQAARDHDGALPPPDPGTAFGLGAADADWLRRRQLPHPFGPYLDPLAYDADRLARLPRSYIACTAPALASTQAHQQRVRGWPGVHYSELATGHCPMVSTPDELVRELLRAAAR